MDQLFKFINNLNSAQRAVIVGGFSILFVLLISLLIYSNLKSQDKKLTYTIASSLTKNQVMLASNELEAAGIEFAVIGSGNTLTLKTSKEFINIAKIKLVTSEASTSKHVGWEIFEKSSLGTTNFENKVKYLRALEGELSRSLESLSGILRASLKIAIPKDSIFTERKADPTASAVLTLKPGIYLTKSQIDGIKNFIASAVSNLKHENIKLIDQDGSMLEESKDDMDNLNSVTQNKYRAKVEKGYEKKIIALLEPFVGEGRVVARVSIDFNFSKRNIQEEIYEPEGTIRSQQTTENVSSSKGEKSGSNGVAGVQSNIENNDTGSGDGSSNSSNESSKNVINYEISKKIIQHEDNNYSTINKISAAVTFDSSVLKDVSNKDEFLSSIKSVVQDTIGYDDRRGDKITVKDFKFLGFKELNNNKDTSNGQNSQDDVAEESTDTLSMIKSIFQELGDYIQYLIAAVLLFIFYKKFIVNHEVIVLNDKPSSRAGKGKTSSGGSSYGANPEEGYDEDFNLANAKVNLKAKVRNQILNNIEGLHEEDAAKYEILIEQLDKEVKDNPTEIANMIDLLLTEGNSKFKGNK